MTKERVFVPDDVRAKAIAEIRGGRSRKEVAAELGVALPTVHLWMAKAKSRPPVASQAARQATGGVDDEYVAGLKMRIQQLELEVKHLQERIEFEIRRYVEMQALYESKK